MINIIIIIIYDIVIIIMEEKLKNESFKANSRSNRKWNRLKRRSRLCEQEEVKWSTMRKQ